MIRRSPLIVILIVAFFSLAAPSFAGIEPNSACAAILVDASRDGGLWWMPRSAGGYQGQELAEYLRSQGFVVDELPAVSTVTVTWPSFSKYGIVIRASAWEELNPYSDGEIAAYLDWVNAGGQLLLVTDHARSRASDALAAAFGLRFVGALGVRGWGSAWVEDLVEHPITAGVDRIAYLAGSLVESAPPSATYLGFVDGLPVLGVLPYGRGQVVFYGDVNGLQGSPKDLGLPQPFIDNLFNYLCDGAWAR